MRRARWETSRHEYQIILPMSQFARSRTRISVASPSSSPDPRVPVRAGGRRSRTPRRPRSPRGRRRRRPRRSPHGLPHLRLDLRRGGAVRMRGHVVEALADAVDRVELPRKSHAGVAPAAPENPAIPPRTTSATGRSSAAGRWSRRAASRRRPDRAPARRRPESSARSRPATRGSGAASSRGAAPTASPRVRSAGRRRRRTTASGRSRRSSRRDDLTARGARLTGLGGGGPVRASRRAPGACEFRAGRLRARSGRRGRSRVRDTSATGPPTTAG